MCFEYKFGSSLAFSYYFMVVLYSCWNGLADLTGQPKLLNRHVQTYIVHAHAHLSCGRKLLAPIWHCTVQASDAAVATRTDIQSPYIRFSRYTTLSTLKIIRWQPMSPDHRSNPAIAYDILCKKNHHLVSPLLLNRLSTHTHASDNRDVSNTWPAITWWAGVEHRYKHHSFLSQTGSCMFSCR